MQAAVVPFQIIVGGRGTDGNYSLRAAAAGRTAEASLALPQLPADAIALGNAFGRALFPPPLRQLLLDVARGADESGARLQLQLQVSPPELATLPWEWLSLGSQTAWQPALREDYALVRVGQRTRSLPTLSVSGPLRVLIACAPGCDRDAITFGTALADEVRAGRMVVDLLRDADPITLGEALDEEPCHILHIIAPASIATRETSSSGFFRLRLGRGVDPAGLTGLLEERAGLRLVSLGGPTPEDTQALTGLATAVHERSGMTMISLGGLDAEQAAIFAGACFGALAMGSPADLAVTHGRTALADAGAPWGLPQICQAPGGEELFSIHPAAPQRTYAAPDPDPYPRTERYERSPKRDATLGTTARDPLPSRRSLARRQPRPARSTPPLPRVNWRLAVLIVASILLLLLVARSLQRPDDAGAGSAQAAEASGASIDTLAPVIHAAVNTKLADLGQVGPQGVSQANTYVTYITANGESLDQIAQRAGSDAFSIVAYNHLSPTDPLRPGRPLVIPVYRQGEPLPAAPIINRGSTERPQVALTFDIEIDDVTLYGILDIMKQRGVKGTFFVTGRWVSSYPEAAKRIVAEGHELGNHSLTHPSFSAIGLDGMKNELDETERIVKETTGSTTKPYFRFPYGDSTDVAVQKIAGMGFIAYHWSVDDSAMPAWLAQAAVDPTQVYGGILLMHGRQSTVDNLSSWLDQLKAIGLEPVTLSAVLK